MMYSDAEIHEIVMRSIATYGAEHTHAEECDTWRGKNWVGACNCDLGRN